MKKKDFWSKTSFRLLKLLSLSISALLGVFCNCGTALYGPPLVPLYGVRVAKFNVSGTIRSADKNIPIGGLSVCFRDTVDTTGIIDSTRTDSLGKYSMEFLWPRLEQTGKLTVNDIDSSENGLFIAKDTLITLPEGASLIDLKIESGNQ